jgi:Fe2+ or Zn2+ uptake regulation protein
MKSRKTRQKEELMRRIEEFDGFFSAEDLALKADSSLATIYRFLSDMEKKKEVFSYSCKGRKTYSKEKRSHCHFECEKTGKIIHFDVDNIDFLKDKIPGEIKSFQIEVKGVCTECKIER